MTNHKRLTYSSGLLITAACAMTSEYALGLWALYYSVRQLRKLSSLMS